MFKWLFGKKDVKADISIEFFENGQVKFIRKENLDYSAPVVEALERLKPLVISTRQDGDSFLDIFISGKEVRVVADEMTVDRMAYAIDIIKNEYD